MEVFDLVAQLAWAVLDSAPCKGSSAAPILLWASLAFTPLTGLEAKALPAIESPSHFEVKCLTNFAEA